MTEKHTEARKRENTRSERERRKNWRERERGGRVEKEAEIQVLLVIISTRDK